MDFFSKCDKIRSFLRIWSHLLNKSLIENFISHAVFVSFNPLQPGVAFLYPLKTSENVCFQGV